MAEETSAIVDAIAAATNSTIVEVVEAVIVKKSSGSGLTFIIVMCVALILYYVVDAMVSKYHPRMGHATTFILIACSAFSLIYYRIHGETIEDQKSMQFKPSLYWNFLIPLLVINGGYHMPRDKFVRNLGNIMIISIVVTFVCMALYAVMAWLTITKFQLSITRYTNSLDPTQPETDSEFIDIPFMKLLMFCALIACSDMGVCLGIGDFGQHDNLATTAGGECGINPIVAIVTFGIIKGMQDKAFTAATPLIIVSTFCLQIVCVLIGVAYGLLTCLMFKHWRFLSASTTIASFIMAAIGFLAYFTANATVFLGTMMNPGLCTYIFFIIQAHYNWYNLTAEGRLISSAIYQFLA